MNFHRIAVLKDGYPIVWVDPICTADHRFKGRFHYTGHFVAYESQAAGIQNETAAKLIANYARVLHPFAEIGVFEYLHGLTPESGRLKWRMPVNQVCFEIIWPEET